MNEDYKELREPMTKKQRCIYEGILEYQNETGYSPTIRELGNICGLSSPSSVLAHLRALEDKGYIARKPECSRTILLLN